MYIFAMYIHCSLYLFSLTFAYAKISLLSRVGVEFRVYLRLRRTYDDFSLVVAATPHELNHHAFNDSGFRYICIQS